LPEKIFNEDGGQQSLPTRHKSKISPKKFNFSLNALNLVHNFEPFRFIFTHQMVSKNMN
jgi:hypothetical protein